MSVDEVCKALDGPLRRHGCNPEGGLAASTISAICWKRNTQFILQEIAE